MIVPKEVRKISDTRLNLTWNDGHHSQFDAQTLRQQCRCAACQNELTGERKLDPNRISNDIKLLKLELTGNYALSFTFSDGHQTGIFPFTLLRKICPCCQSEEEQ